MTNEIEHEMKLSPDAKPIAEPLRRRALSQIEETRRKVSKLLKDGIIEESAYVLAKKKEWRNALMH